MQPKKLMQIIMKTFKTLKKKLLRTENNHSKTDLKFTNTKLIKNVSFNEFFEKNVRAKFLHMCGHSFKFFGNIFTPEFFVTKTTRIPMNF